MKLIKTADKQGVMYSLSGDNLPENYVLSKQNCDSLFGLVDVEDLANETWKDLGVFTENDKHLWFGGFRNGFKKAIELYQPKKIEVEIEMENYGYCEGCRKAGMWHCAYADTCGYAETRERPKLDSEGCLILQRNL